MASKIRSSGIGERDGGCNCVVGVDVCVIEDVDLRERWHRHIGQAIEDINPRRAGNHAGSPVLTRRAAGCNAGLRLRLKQHIPGRVEDASTSALLPTVAVVTSTTCVQPTMAAASTEGLCGLHEGICSHVCFVILKHGAHAKNSRETRTRNEY